MLYEVVLTSDSIDEILKCGHSKQSYLAVRFLLPFVMFSAVWKTKIEAADFFSFEF